MLLEFSVKNFLSIKNEVIFSLYASDKIKGHEEYNLIPAGGRHIIKTAAVYGANASGKSNLIKAMGFMRSVIVNSLKLNPDEPIVPAYSYYPSFQLHTETAEAPIEMEVIFLYKDIYYRYGFVLDAERIYREWLYHAPKKRELLLFKRSADRKGKTFFSKIFAGAPDVIKNRTPDNTLLLAALAKFTDSPALRVMEWVGNIFNVIAVTDDGFYKGFTYDKLDEKEYQKDILRLLKIADTGIENVLLESLTEEDLLKNDMLQELRNRLKKNIKAKQVVFQHSIFNDMGEPIGTKRWGQNNESAGTQKLFALSGLLIETLRKGEILIIDELDARLHPMIMRFILSLFHSKEDNPHGAQLIFATHDTQLLSPRFFRRDQIWFTEKDTYGATDLYSLADFELDDDADFSREYFQGRYNAVPFIGDLSLFYKGVEHGEKYSDAGEQKGHKTQKTTKKGE